MKRTAEGKAAARAKAPADLELLIQRSSSMVEGAIDLLEAEYVQFQSEGKGVPFKFLEQLQSTVGSLDKLSLAHSRVRKSDDGFWERSSVDAKLEALQTFLLALYKEQPGLVNDWLRTTVRLVNTAGDTVRAAAVEAHWSQRGESLAKPDVEEREEYLDPDGW